MQKYGLKNVLLFCSLFAKSESHINLIRKKKICLRIERKLKFWWIESIPITVFWPEFFLRTNLEKIFREKIESGKFGGQNLKSDQNFEQKFFVTESDEN